MEHKTATAFSHLVARGFIVNIRVLVRDADRRVTFLSNSFAVSQLTNGVMNPSSRCFCSLLAAVRFVLPRCTLNVSTRSHQEEDEGTMIHLDLLTADVYHPANEGETVLLLSESLSLPKVCNARRTRSERLKNSTTPPSN